MYSPYCQKMSTRDTRCLHRRTGGRYRCSVPPLWCSLSLFLFVAFKCPPFDLCTATYCYLFFFLLFWFVQNIIIAILYTQRVKRSMNVMLLYIRPCRLFLVGRKYSLFSKRNYPTWVWWISVCVTIYACNACITVTFVLRSYD